MHYLIVENSNSKQGVWEIPDHLFGVFASFMEALSVGTTQVRYTGTDASAPWIVRPKLLHTGMKKIAGIKLIREYYGLGLREAKELTDRAPVVLPPLSHARALMLQQKFVEENCGAIEIPNALDLMASALR